MKNEIPPPDIFQLEQEIDDLFPHGDITAVSNLSGIKYKRLYNMVKVDEPQESCISDTFRIWYGVTRNDKEKGVEFFRKFERQAIKWKLADGSPLAVLRAAVEHIPQIQPQEIKQLSDEDQLKVLSYVTVLRKAIEDIANAWCSARAEEYMESSKA